MSASHPLRGSLFSSISDSPTPPSLTRPPFQDPSGAVDSLMGFFEGQSLEDLGSHLSYTSDKIMEVIGESGGSS